jgi:hypothetical protein
MVYNSGFRMKSQVERQLYLELEPVRLFPVSGISVSGIVFRVPGLGFRVSGLRISGT